MARANAFAEILPPSASSSTPTKEARYDVFINHRGPDTKQTLAASIYHTLKPLGVEVFLDEPELELGDSIPSGIQHAITTSFLHIAILSPRYAESTWCLEELSLMLKTGQTVIPVFYNVDVNDIRRIKGSYAEYFSKLEAKNRYRSEKLEDWKSALEKVSYLKGHIVNNEDDEGRLKKNIIEYLLRHPKRISFVVAKHPVGLDEILQDFERSILRSSKNVKIVGIIGMGGCGKTTLAKEYFNKKKQSFYRCSFVCDVQDTSTKKLLEKQERMFQDLGGSKDILFYSVEEGRAILAEYLRSIQVCIILDDLDHLDQLESFLPIKDNLKSGSVIVVTSRNSSILTSWGIPSESIYKMKKLNSKHAMELFCWHAFKQPSPIDEFQYLVEEFLKVCQGLPLALKVLGGAVHGNESKEDWDGLLNKVSRILPQDSKKILKVSFDGLDEEDKEIFLDISCFFLGAETLSAIPVWNESGWSGAFSLRTLVNKCLVEVDEENCLIMHDLLRDLGKDISMTWSPYRLWSEQQITHIEKDGKESVLIRGIKAQTDDFFEECMEIVRRSGGRLKRHLKILDVEINCITEELATLIPGLVWLRWGNFPSTALQPWIPLNNLRVLELREGPKLEEPWSETADPPVQLRVLNIIHAGSFQRFPSSIGFLKNLTEISFDGKGAPIEGLPEEFCCLQSLERLTLDGCHKLKSLPNKIGDLTNLWRLRLKGCSGIEGLPEEFCRLKSLERLTLDGCDKLKSLPRKFGDLRNLQHLFLIQCSRIEGLPEEFCRLQSLEYLELIGCDELKSLPSKFGDLTNLRNLQIWYCDGLMIPSETLAQHASLDFLRICGCPGLTEFVIQPGCFSSSFCRLSYMDISVCPVSRISISPQCYPNLKRLDLYDNHDLVEIHSLPKSVEHIWLHTCSKLESISLNGGLKNLRIERCGELRKIEGLQNSRSLEVLNGQTTSRVPLIQSLKNMESLCSVNLTAACHISVFEACLQTLNIEKWPMECIICCKTEPGVEAILKSFTFPGLTLVDSLVRETDGHTYVFSKELSSEAAMICLVLNSASAYLALCVTCVEPIQALTLMDEGKWVYMGVFTQSIPVRRKVEFSLSLHTDIVPFNCIEIGMLAMGEEKRVVDAFYELLQRLGKAGDVCEGQ